jgi:hypothetical protein
MRYRRLFILVEGDDDARFFEAVIVRRFKALYAHVAVWKYAQQKKAKVASLITSICHMGADYWFVKDCDEAPCVTACKGAVRAAYPMVTSQRVVVVRTEIESWYCAGIDDAAAGQLGIKSVDWTDALTKEQFDECMPERFDSSATLSCSQVQGETSSPCRVSAL